MDFLGCSTPGRCAKRAHKVSEMPSNIKKRSRTYLCVLGTAISIKCFKQPFIASHILHVEAAIVVAAVLEAAPKRITEEATFRIDATLGWVGIRAAVMSEYFSIPLGAPLADVGTTLQVVNTVVVAVTVPLINATANKNCEYKKK